MALHIPIWWSDGLYGPDLGARINEILDGPSAPLAIINHVLGRRWGSGPVDESLDFSGPEHLVMTSRGYRIDKQAPRLLPRYASTEHRYRKCVYAAEEPGLCWRVFLHREFAVVLSPAARAKRTKAVLEQDTVVIMTKPASAHERLLLPRRIARMREQASGLLDYVWSSGIVLKDLDDYLPDRHTPA